MAALIDLLMPPACAACGRSGAILCERCLATLRTPSRPSQRFLAPDGGVVVGASMAMAVAAFAYEGPMRRALAALKYSGASRLAPVLARAAEPALSRLLALSRTADLVPVPVHIERRRTRGYNQAELLARQLAGLAGLRVADVLLRARPTSKQHRLDRAARLRNLRGAFLVRPGAAAPHTAIVVDDIVTTTATLEACASVLRDAGCQAVYGFAVAREV